MHHQVRVVIWWNETTIHVPDSHVIEYVEQSKRIGFGAEVSRPADTLHELDRFSKSIPMAFGAVGLPLRSLATLPLGMKILGWNPDWSSLLKHEWPESYDIW